MKNKKNKKIYDHIWLKLLSLALAFFIWFLVSNLSDPTVSKTISGIAVQQLNGDAVNQSGYVYDVVSGDTVDIVIRGPRSIVEILEAENFYATADLSNLSITNTAEIVVNTNASIREKESKQITIKPVDNNMKLTIEEKVSESFKVRIITTGSVASGHALGTAVSTPNIVTLEGPKSVIEDIAEVRAIVPVDNIREDLVETVSLSCIDAYGQAVDKDNVTLSESEVEVTVPVYNTKEIPIVVSTVGNPADGYAERSIEYNPETIEIAGEDEILEKITEITIKNIDISGAAENVENNISIISYLPDDVVLADEDDQLSISVKIEQLATASIVLQRSDIKLTGENSDYSYKVTFADDETMIQIPVTITGFSDIVDNKTIDDLTPSVDVTDLGIGSYDLILDFADSDDYEIKEKYYLKVDVSEKQTDSEE